MARGCRWQYLEDRRVRYTCAPPLRESHEDFFDRADQNAESLSLFTPESLQQAEEAGELDVDSNILGLKPDPVRFVRFVKGLGRADVSSELFVRLLEGYRELRTQRDAEPLR